MSQSDTELRQLLGPVTTAQWHWKPDEESWSLCQMAEHLVIVEQGVTFRLRTAPADGIEKTMGKQ